MLQFRLGSVLDRQLSGLEHLDYVPSNSRQHSPASRVFKKEAGHRKVSVVLNEDAHLQCRSQLLGNRRWLQDIDICTYENAWLPTNSVRLLLVE